MRDSVLITGSSRGLGEALAREFAKHDHFVILHGRDEELLSQAGFGTGKPCLIIVGDLRDMATIEGLALAAEQHEVGILINNAGQYLNQPLTDIGLTDLQDLLAVNLAAPILLSQKIYPIMAKLGGGLILNINSLAVDVPSAGETVYAASKGGLKAFTKALNMEGSKDFVHCMNVTIGAMDTALQYGRTDPAQCISTQEAATVIYGLAAQYQTLRLTEVEIKRARY